MKDEVAAIAQAARGICKAARCDLAHVARMQLYLLDLAELPAALEAWNTALDGIPLPVSAMEVPWLPIPGARIMADLWVLAAP